MQCCDKWYTWFTKCTWHNQMTTQQNAHSIFSEAYSEEWIESITGASVAVLEALSDPASDMARSSRRRGRCCARRNALWMRAALILFAVVNPLLGKIARLVGASATVWRWRKERREKKSCQTMEGGKTLLRSDVISSTGILEPRRAHTHKLFLTLLQGQGVQEK
jgi:hypothetical protein